MRTTDAMMAELLHVQLRMENIGIRLPGIVIKLILSGVAAYYMVRGFVGDGKTPVLQIALLACIAASMVYMLCSLFGFCLNFTRNYLIAIVAFFAALFGVAYLGEKLTAGSKLMNDILGIVAIIAMVLLVVNDIRRLVLYFGLKQRYNTVYAEIQACGAQAAAQMAEEAVLPQSAASVNDLQMLAGNPKFVLNASRTLKKSLGRTPTDEEVEAFVLSLLQGEGAAAQ